MRRHSGAALIAGPLSQYATDIAYRWREPKRRSTDKPCSKDRCDRRDKNSGGYFLTDLFEAGHLVGLRAFRALDDIELHLIPLFKAFVSFALNRTVMNKYVCPAIAAEEAVALRIVEPLYGAFILCQLSYSLAFMFATSDAAYRLEKISQRNRYLRSDANCAEEVFS
jgi:hypothetical protein